MKLRIQDDSIRFRLTRGEVEKLAREGRVESSVQFAAEPNTALNYAIETSLSEEIRAERTSNGIRVMVPKRLAEALSSTDQVGIEHLQVVRPDVALHIAVEKDFRCAHGAAAVANDKASDFYPNPNLATASSE